LVGLVDAAGAANDRGDSRPLEAPGLGGVGDGYGGVAAAGIVARIFVGTWRRYLWDRAALLVLLMSLGSPLGLALGVIPVSPIDPTNELLISFKEGIALIYAVLHFTTYFAVQRTVAKEFTA
jgi:hypothetical protein